MTPQQFENLLNWIEAKVAECMASASGRAMEYVRTNDVAHRTAALAHLEHAEHWKQFKQLTFRARQS